jgi:hypothetical protein
VAALGRLRRRLPSGPCPRGESRAAAEPYRDPGKSDDGATERRSGGSAQITLRPAARRRSTGSPHRFTDVPESPATAVPGHRRRERRSRRHRQGPVPHRVSRVRIPSPAPPSPNWSATPAASALARQRERAARRPPARDGYPAAPGPGGSTHFARRRVRACHGEWPLPDLSRGTSSREPRPGRRVRIPAPAAHGGARRSLDGWWPRSRQWSRLIAPEAGVGRRSPRPLHQPIARVSSRRALGRRPPALAGRTTSR